MTQHRTAEGILLSVRHAGHFSPVSNQSHKRSSVPTDLALGICDLGSALIVIEKKQTPVSWMSAA